VLREVPEYRVRARNTSRHSANEIHDDAIARRFGFRGGLVPGVTVYAYMTPPLVAALGRDWLERGSASVRFLKPVYADEEIAVRTAGVAGDPAAVELTVVNPAGDVCAVLTARVGTAAPAVDLATYPARELPADPPVASRAVLAALDVLGSPVLRWDEGAAEVARDKFGDLDGARGAEARAHPAVFLEQANRALDGNVRLGPWVHTGSDVRHLGQVALGERLTTRGRVRRLFEKRSHEFVELDLVIVAGDTRPVAQLSHTAIYQLRAP
jgi:acyl dehydratase